MYITKPLTCMLTTKKKLIVPEILVQRKWYNTTKKCLKFAFNVQYQKEKETKWNEVRFMCALI